MADPRRPQQAPPLPPKENFDANGLTAQFEHLLRTQRLNNFHGRPQRWVDHGPSPYRPSSSPPQPSRQAPHPPSQHCSSSRGNYPRYPTQPQDPTSIRFHNQLRSHSRRPLNYENPGLLDEALTVVPLDRIYGEAEDECELFKAQAASISPHKKPEWGYQDCVIRALLRWFKTVFFTYVCNPSCSYCGMPTVACGFTPPTDEETVHGATKVELYQCPTSNCRRFERFPRYGDVWTLLKTRRGRVGEWTDCFSMLCRAMGTRVRFVWTSGSADYNWTEIYSEHHARWIHVDACEGAWDQPRMYTEGWGWKFAYCIAFGTEGATDVTRRYVRNAASHGKDRNKAPEEVLLYIIDDIRRIRREEAAVKNDDPLKIEDEREEKELRGYVIQALAASISNTLPREENKHQSEREATAAWRQAQLGGLPPPPGSGHRPREGQ